MLPGKTYKPHDILRIALRGAWFIVLPCVVGATLAFLGGQHLPKKYAAETLIMVVPQRIPQSYVKEGGTENIEDRLATLQDQILSRSRLERIIVDLDLYPRLRTAIPMEDVVAQMRDDITIATNISKPARGNSSQSASFSIKYVGERAATVQKATARLASLFIEENLRDRENVAEGTTAFLESQLEDARQRLVEQEKKLEEYRRRYSGELPTQASANMQAIQSIQVQVQTLGEATDRARERRLLLEREISDLSLPQATPPETAPAKGAVVQTTAQQLDTARAQLQMLLQHDKPDHPDVRMMQRTIRNLEVKQVEEAKAGPAGNAPITPAEATALKHRRDLEAELASVERELQDKQDQDKKLRQQLTDYQAKLDAIPSRESDLTALSRDYDTLKSTYESLLSKREDAKLAANLESRNIGEQFRVLDPARLPEKPVSPNIPVIAVAGGGLGLLLGVVIVGLREYLDGSFTTDTEVVRICRLPVLALIPDMPNEQERAAKRRRTVLVNIAGATLVLVALAVVVLASGRF